MPGVVSASGTSSLPIGGGGFYLGRVFLSTGQPEPPASTDTPAQSSHIQPAYLRTMGVPLVAGRDFNQADTATSNPVILISRSMALQMFGNEHPLGRRIRSWRDENRYREIVGVAGDLHYSGLGGIAATTSTSRTPKTRGPLWCWWQEPSAIRARCCGRFKAPSGRTTTIWPSPT